MRINIWNQLSNVVATILLATKNLFVSVFFVFLVDETFLAFDHEM